MNYKILVFFLVSSLSQLAFGVCESNPTKEFYERDALSATDYAYEQIANIVVNGELLEHSYSDQLVQTWSGEDNNCELTNVQTLVTMRFQGAKEKCQFVGRVMHSYLGDIDFTSAPNYDNMMLTAQDSFVTRHEFYMQIVEWPSCLEKSAN